jgi:hypothetical protein
MIILIKVIINMSSSIHIYFIFIIKEKRYKFLRQDDSANLTRDNRYIIKVRKQTTPKSQLANLNLYTLGYSEFKYLQPEIRKL